MQKLIYLLRHEESKAQTEEELSFDAELSEKGRQNSFLIQEKFNGVFFDKVFVSPLKRARETYEIAEIAKNRLRTSHIENQIKFDARLIEAMPKGSYDAILPYKCEEKIVNSDAWNKDIKVNLENFICDLRKDNFKTCLIIGHNGFFNLMLKYILGVQDINYKTAFENYCRIDNGSFSLIAIDDENPKKDCIKFWNIRELRND